MHVIAYREALVSLLQGASRGDVEHVACDEAQGRILAAPVRSPFDLPRFDNAALDGHAVFVEGDGVDAGQEWRIAGEGVAGEPPGALVAGQARGIMTGAPMPAGANAVLPLEQVQAIADGARIRLSAAARPGQHVRRRGEDVETGVTVMPAGDVLRSGHVALLAALGIARIPVVRKPRVALIATGRELAPPHAALRDAQIHDSSTPYIVARVAAAGGDVVHRRRVGDDPDAFLHALDEALAHDADLILGTGAVSRGAMDFVPGAIGRHGGDIRFHGVGIRPGKPVLHARLRGGAPFLGLPGNPLATAVGVRFFAEPLLRAMLGLPPEPRFRLPLATPWAQRMERRVFLMAQLRCSPGGILAAHLLPRQESFRLRPLLAQHAWVVLPENTGDLKAGDGVEVAGLGHLDAPAWQMADAP